MSINLINKLFGYKFSDLVTDDGKNVSASSCKFVMLALVDHANAEGTGAYPSVSLIELKTALSRPTVIAALNALQAAGFIFSVGKSKRRTNNYSINVEKLNNPPEISPEEVQPTDEIVKPLYHHQLTHFTDDSKATLLKSSLNHQLTPAASDKIRAACNASPAWAIGHGEVPTQITDEQRERDNVNQFPPQYQGFAEAYILETKRLATKNEISRWSLAFKEMTARGVTPEILTATIREMRNKGLTITWPGSCTNMAAAKVAGRRRVEVEAPAQLEDIFSRPAFIPENRWRKATQ